MVIEIEEYDIEWILRSMCILVVVGCEWDLFMDFRDYIGSLVVIIIYIFSKDVFVIVKFKNIENLISFIEKW